MGAASRNIQRNVASDASQTTYCKNYKMMKLLEIKQPSAPRSRRICWQNLRAVGDLFVE